MAPFYFKRVTLGMHFCLFLPAYNRSMFLRIATLILRNKLPLLAGIILLTAFFGYKATKIELSYEFAKVLPLSDPHFQDYLNFKSTFGEDGSVMVIGVTDSSFFTLEKFNQWFDLGNRIKKIDGIEAVVSVAGIYTIEKNEDERKFELKPVIKSKPTSQAELDSLKAIIDNLPFYQGFIVNKETGANLMAITFDRTKLNSKNRIAMVDTIKNLALDFGKKNNLPVHLSGMPFIRTGITSKVAGEMKLFLLLAILVTALILLVFFRSVIPVIFSLIVVIIGVIWSLGTIVLLHYKITILSGLIPPLLIVIGIPNCIFLLNKYHSEFKQHGNKVKSLTRMVQRIGLTTFLANLTTAIGFGVFYFTKSNILMEFGLVAAANVMATYLISLILIPIAFSYLPEPDVRHTKHLQAKRINFLLEWIDKIVHNHYKAVFATVIVIIAISFFGMMKITTVGYVVDDLPKKDPIYVDMKYFETNFKGVLPLEFSIDCLKPGGVFSMTTLQKINRFEKMLSGYPEFSKPLSIVDAIKFSNQGYHDGDPKYFILPGALDLADLSGYLGENRNKNNLFRSFLDSNKQQTRVSVQMADIGSIRTKSLLARLEPRIDSIFTPGKYKTVTTGNTLIFLKGNDYLFTNLKESILLAIFLISIIMVLLFMSFRMIAISILPSLIPLLVTAGLMGFFNIALKPSTILIFSIAFGISSDQTIYFLTKYRQEIRMKHMSISRAVSKTILETGVSMIYTAIILFAGFFIFAASSFGGTAALGKLISFTLLLSMCSNIILLPAFLIALERKITTKAFIEEPLLQIFDEEEDIDLDNLEIKKSPEEPES
jgi:predicted RND superfamily exporter protein